MNFNLTSSSTTLITVYNSTSRPTRAFSTFYDVWYVLFFIVVSLNFIGNILVMVVIATDSKFHSKMNFLFINMAFSDFLAGVFSLLWYVVNNVTPEWRSEWVCRVVAANSITVLSGLVSIFTLSAITLERYDAIVRPLEHRMSWLRFKVMLLLIWTLAIVFSSPYVIFTNIVENNNTKRCMFLLGPGQWERQFLTTLVFVFMYVCPNTVICVAYVKLVKHLWFTEENESMQKSRQALLRSRKKITKLLGSVLIVFNLCTFPNFVADFMLSFGLIGYGHKFPTIVFLIQLMSTCVNPFIFFIQSNQFRSRLIDLLFCRAKKINRWSTFRGTGMSSKSLRKLSVLSNQRQTMV